MKKENDVLEETLSIAENGYAAAYQFLLEEYEKNPENYGPQHNIFLRVWQAEPIRRKMHWNG